MRPSSGSENLSWTSCRSASCEDWLSGSCYLSRKLPLWDSHHQQSLPGDTPVGLWLQRALGMCVEGTMCLN